MKLEGDYLFEATVPEVWSALFDPVILAAVMPGCEKLELVDGHYVGDIKVKVGPIQGKFTGKVDLQDKVEPRSYTMIVDGRGAPGFVKATARVELAAEGEGTRVHYDADAQVGRRLARERCEDAGERAADLLGDVAVDLVAVQAADVVGLEDAGGQGRGHASNSPASAS